MQRVWQKMARPAAADLFALGAMLFKQLTGRRAFDRESRVVTLNAILHDEVPGLAVRRQASRLR
jgi:hypothetical protein